MCNIELINKDMFILMQIQDNYFNWAIELA
jgi:hypothetical protein